MKREGVFCKSHYFDVTIGADYGVYPCCLVNYLNDYEMVNLMRYNSFKEAWLSEERKGWIKRFTPECSYACWMADVNKMIFQKISEGD